LVKRTLVATVMSNMGLELALKRHGGKLKRTAVGDRYVVEHMREHGYSFGGEQSGHLVFSEHATTGDGVVAALQVLAGMVREQRPLSELSQVMTRVPQVLKNLTLRERLPLERMPHLRQVTQSVESKLKDDGRVLNRWSGTESKLRIMLEGPRLDELHTMAEELAFAAEQDTL